MTRIAARLLALISMLVFAAAMPAVAEEYIDSYHAVIGLAADGAVTVTETITANAEGQDIRRGIFRDVPLSFVDAAGKTVSVPFKVDAVERDGLPEDWRTETIPGGIRIYSGSADRLLSRGEHAFQFTYTTARQIRFFDDHDEFYWNVTGNGWAFRINEATATVTLPAGARPTDMAFFTGPFGATEKNARVMREGDDIFFATTAPLRPGDGLTIAVKLAKGVITPPSSAQQRAWFLQDNLGAILALGSLVLVLAYYTRAWSKVGRDPARGVIVPRWDPPDGISPALVNYVDNKGFSGEGWTALSATALELAVKGYVVLEDLKNAIIIRRTHKPAPADLPAGQRALLDSVGKVANDTLTIDEDHGKEVQKAGTKFRQSIESEHRGKYYRANAGYTVAGIFLSLTLIVVVLIFGNLDEATIATVFVMSFFVVFFGLILLGFASRFRRGHSLRSRIGAIIGIGFVVTFFVLTFASLTSAMLFDLAHSVHLPVVIGLGGIVLTNILYLFLMGAPTPLGAKLMDGIDGLRQYLTLAERDRMNMQGIPTMSPAHFETLLPYAVALGVEQPWSQTFEKWIATADVADRSGYQPGWYAGQFHGNIFADRIGGFAGSMASTIASTIPAPPSSSSSAFSGGSGGGGGSSGGGGGGGGGGGW